MIRFRPLRIPTLFFAPALALLLGLGVWQIERLHWKEDLIARVQGRIAAPAVPLDDALANGLADAEWRHVSVRGHFLHDKEQYLFAPSREGEPGDHVVTPLVLGDGKSVLVDRGYVPESMRDPATRPASLVESELTVTGVLRLSQPPGLFTPAPDRIRRIWFARDVPSMAAAAGIRLAAPVMIEADAAPNPGGFPVGGQTRVDFPNNHLQYAITWFALALALIAIYLLYHRSQGRLTWGGPRQGKKE